MAQFTFTAKKQDGSALSGVLESPDRVAAMKSLSEKDLVVTMLAPMEQKKKFFGLLDAKVRGEDLLMFTQELSAMLDSGMSTVTALEVLSIDVENPKLKTIVLDLEAGLNAGKQLSETMKKYPEVFSGLYTSMLEAGEASGNVPMILTKLGDYIENSEFLTSKVKSALYYPAMVVIFALMVVTFMLIFGIPRLKSIYDGLEVSLPFFTLVLINTATFLSTYWYIFLGAILIAFFSLRAYLSTDSGLLALDHMKLRLPIFGPLFQKLAIARFSATLSTLYSSGVPIMQSLVIVAGSTGNKVIEQVVLETVKSLREGHSIVEPLRKSGVFTNLAISMMDAGEKSGTLEKMLPRISRFYEVQVDISIKALAGLIEPLIIIVIGILIGCVILALALPFMSLGTIVH
jgi:type IV pilus assembly protein PilC